MDSARPGRRHPDNEPPRDGVPAAPESLHDPHERVDPDPETETGIDTGIGTSTSTGSGIDTGSGIGSEAGAGPDHGAVPAGGRLRRRGQGELEAQVLAVLRSAGGPATAGWVQEHLDGDLAYTTVITILSRLYAKKAVTRSREGRSYTWTSASDEAGLAALRMRRVLDGERDRDAVLARFVSALSPGDEERLRELLARADAPDGPGRRRDTEGL